MTREDIFPVGYAPSSLMMKEVGLDFDEDVGGLRIRTSRPRLSWPWALMLLVVFSGLAAASPVLGVGIIIGLAVATTGCLIVTGRRTPQAADDHNV